MKNLKGLRASAQTLKERAHAILALSETEDRDINEDEQKQIADLVEDQRKISAQIDTISAVETMTLDLDTGTGRVTEPDEVATDGQEATGVKVIKTRVEDDPARGFASPRDFIMGVMDAGMGRTVQHDGLNSLSLKNVKAAVSTDEQQELADRYGGFLVPPAFSPSLLSRRSESDPTAGLTTNVPMAGPEVAMPARVDSTHTSSVSGGLTVGRKSETIAASSSRMEFEQVRLRAHSLFGLSYVTEELLTDSAVSFAALIAAGFADEFLDKIFQEKLDGTGVGEYEGVNSNDALISITKETGQAATTLVYENIIKIRARVYGYGNAIWIANHDTLPQLMLLNQSVGTGGAPLWQPSAREDHPDTLLGRPLFFSEHMQTLGTAGDILCGDWSQYLEGTLQGLQSAESIHVRFAEHERAFKFWLRNAGACWWRAALTPNVGSTLSPFVRVATRS